MGNEVVPGKGEITDGTHALFQDDLSGSIE
jgi:hypothetical protein